MSIEMLYGFIPTRQTALDHITLRWYSMNLKEESSFLSLQTNEMLADFRPSNVIESFLKFYRR